MEVPESDPKILRYYSHEWDEDGRIRSGLHEIELIRTREIVRRFLPSGPLSVLDVGGGSGVHAEWLLDDGHTVQLVDPVSRLVEQASERLGDRSRFSSQVGDARSLEQADASFDAVMLLGPLYHLTRRFDRLRAWREAHRVTREGGLVFGVGISRFAELSAGLSRGLIFVQAFRDMAARTLEDGQHRNPDGCDYFTTAFYHRPDELEAEAAEAGWSVRGVLGVEGFAGSMPHLEEHWSDPTKRAIIIDAARSIESEPSLLGLDPHIMVVGERHV